MGLNLESKRIQLSTCRIKGTQLFWFIFREWLNPGVVSEEASYDEMFKDRYTEHDTEYTSRFDAPQDVVPCVERWFTPQKK